MTTVEMILSGPSSNENGNARASMPWTVDVRLLCIDIHRYTSVIVKTSYAALYPPPPPPTPQ